MKSTVPDFIRDVTRRSPLARRRKLASQSFGQAGNTRITGVPPGEAAPDCIRAWERPSLNVASCCQSRAKPGSTLYSRMRLANRAGESCTSFQYLDQKTKHLFTHSSLPILATSP